MSELFKPGKIANMTLKNRFVRSATAECLASDDCRVTDDYLRAYARLARGGVGLIITGNYYVHALGRSLPRIIVVDRDEIIEDLRKVTKVVHEHDSKIVAQLNHGGRQCDPKVLGNVPLAPSAVRDKFTRVKPRAMSESEIEEAVTAFGEAARRAKEAGFDGVQIHGAHGYLITQFLSGYTNRRNDKWGGPFENRMRFLVEVYNSMRSAVGPDYPILIKINAEDFVSGGMTHGEGIAVCKKLDELGIDAIEVSGGILEQGLIYVKGDIPRDLVMRNRNFVERMMLRLVEKSLRETARFEEGYFLPQASEVKKNVKVPVIAVGGIRRRATMEQALKNKQADYISMCRPFIRQPNLVSLMEKGREDPVSCMNCNRCSLEIAAHYNPMKCYYSDSPK
jgi:2,4-dienoyl-CoA reductase-like NADH-dependent reductase (Old Yellow Enzyme family)